MITTHAEFQQTLDQMDRMYRALADLRRDVLPRNAATFAVMAEGPREYVRQFQAAIDEYLGTVEFEEHDVDVWMRLQGTGIEWPDAPTSVLTAFLDAFRKGVQTVAEFMMSGTLATRPTGELKRSCDFRIVAFSPGSLRVGLRLPDAPPMLPIKEFEDIAKSAEIALTTYLEVAAWIDSGDDPEILKSRFADAAHRRVLLNSLKTIIPRPRGNVDAVELSGRLSPRERPIRLTRDFHVRIDEAIDRTLEQQVESHEGDLREIDLDQFAFTIRNISGIQQIQCSFGEELLEVAKAALDRRVRVTGTRELTPGRRQGGKLQVARLVIIDSESDRQTN